MLESEEDWHWRRIYLMFMVGIYTGLRVSDLVRLRAGHVRGEEIILIEEKTDKEQVLPVAVILQRVIADRTAGMDDEDYLFPSRNRRRDGSVKPIETRTAYDDMQKIADRFGLRGSIGCHTLRKTFGYWHYKKITIWRSSGSGLTTRASRSRGGTSAWTWRSAKRACRASCWATSRRQASDRARPRRSRWLSRGRIGRRTAGGTDRGPRRRRRRGGRESENRNEEV